MEAYRVFLSYAHSDERWARWLMRRLETYRVPPRLVGTPGADGPIPARLGAVFRDREELSAAGDLSGTIQTTLSRSQTLIVICSPAAAASRWVNAEISTFRKGPRGDQVMCFVVAGEPGASPRENGCFPPALLAAGANGEAIEPLAADARKEADGRERAFLKLVAGLLGVSFDALAQREAQRRHRRLLAITSASILGMTLAMGLAGVAWVARNDAQRRQAQAQDLLGFMLGDLRQKLTTVGRLDLMRAVDDKATAYFATLKPRDLTDGALEEQARSLTGIGQVRLHEGNHSEAKAAFLEAHARSLALHERKPDDGQRLFDLAQAQYWVGFVALEQGRFDETFLWFRRYRDSALQLAAMDPGNFAWQREVAYGFHNLAVLDDKQGRYEEAEAALRAEMELYRRWIAQHPDDLDLRYEAANVASWLGSIAGRQGRLGEAEALHAEAVAGYTHNVTRDPDNVRWKELRMLALGLQTEARAQRGRRDAARESVDATEMLATELTRLDPSNYRWRQNLAKVRWWQATLEESPRNPDTYELAGEAERMFTDLHVAEPNEEYTLRWLVRARTLLARLALAKGEIEQARDWTARAHAALDPRWQSVPTEALRIELAELLVLGGEISAIAGDRVAADAKWREVISILTQDSSHPLPFERLLPLVEAQRHLGLSAEAEPHARRLRDAGRARLGPRTAMPMPRERGRAGD